jgi:hypothetical protein
MAAVGALLVSSGIALMAAPTPATAVPSKDNAAKVVVCKYVGTPGDSRLQTGDNPLVVSVNTLRNVLDDEFENWLAEPTFPVAWTDAQGQAGGGSLAIGFVGDVEPVIQSCPGYDPGDGDGHGGLTTTASLDLVDPSCDNGNEASFTVTGSHAQIVSAKVDGVEVDATMNEPVSVDPGAFVSVKLKADPRYKFDGVDHGGKFLTLEGTVGEAQVNCTAVTPVAPTFVEPTCTTLPAVQTPTSELVTYAVTGSQVAGGSVQVVATLVNSETTHFAASATTSWDHTFTVPTGCTAVSPPATAPTTTQVSPPKTHVKTEVKAQTTAPTVVHAGLAGPTTDTGVQAGLGLILAGLVLMAGAAGLVLVEGGKE